MTGIDSANDFSERSSVATREIGRFGLLVPALGTDTQAWGDKRFGFGTRYDRDDLYAI